MTVMKVAKADVIGSKSQATSERLHSITVPFHLVPGALAVLVEVRGVGYAGTRLLYSDLSS